MKPVSITRPLKVPFIPNFILIEGLTDSIPIKDISEEDLRALGALWTEKLVETARKRRTTGMKQVCTHKGGDWRKQHLKVTGVSI